MSVIHVLSQEVANRIAAGEVVERPASVLKELVENALDAGARHLEVELEGGGVKLLRVTDDGCGMSADDLRLCILPHATSKISDVDDLFRVASFGFRGEALPSIAAVSDVSITTRPRDGGEALELRVRAGKAEGPMPASGAVGTSVCVRGLFSELPARLRFLKQERTELAQCVEVLTRLLLTESGISARMTHEGRTVLEVRAASDRRQRIAALLGDDIAARLLEVHAGGPGLSLEAWIGPCDLVRRTAEQQHVFLNGRCIRDRSVSFAIKDAWRGLIMPKEHPVALLFIAMDPAQVDVNVHPQKSEVRFRNRDALVGMIRASLRQRLLGEPGPRRLHFPAAVQESMAFAAAPSHDIVRERVSLPPPVALRRTGHRCSSLAYMPDAGASNLPGVSGSGPLRFLQVHRAWIVVESNEGLSIVDQHALHERWLYEELLQRFERAECESQALLVPEQVRRTPAEAALLLEHAELLARFGLVIEAFGTTTLLVRAVPAALRKANPTELLDEALQVLADGEGTAGSSTFVAALAADIACHAAVRFGDRLPDAEVAELLRWWQQNPLLRNCPHGRPVAATISLQELELQFLRKK